MKEMLPKLTAAIDYRFEHGSVLSWYVMVRDLSFDLNCAVPFPSTIFRKKAMICLFNDFNILSV